MVEKAYDDDDTENTSQKSKREAGLSQRKSALSIIKSKSRL